MGDLVVVIVVGGGHGCVTFLGWVGVRAAARVSLERNRRHCALLRSLPVLNGQDLSVHIGGEKWN